MTHFVSPSSALLCLSLQGCLANPDVYQAQLTRYEHLDFSGDPAVGEVIHIRQLHRSNNEIPKIVEQEIGRYQHEMLRELLRRHPAHVFSEGKSTNLQYDFPGQFLKSNSDILEATTAALELFKGPSEENLSLFYHHGAGDLYAAIIGGVTLHRVMTPHEEQYVNAKLEESFDEAFALNETREDWALREILNFLGSRPGSRVALVFGANHAFADNLERLKSKKPLPRFVSVCWRVPDDWNTAKVSHKTCPAG